MHVTDQVAASQTQQPWPKTPQPVVTELSHTSPTSEPRSRSPTSVCEDILRHYSELLSLLSVSEKVALLSGSSFTTTTGITRLAIPQLKVSDSINGVRGTQSHLEDKGTACFPSTTCLASTWNKELLYELGKEVGEQAKLKTVQVVIGPNVNLHRDPRGGRNFETFSEDPLLTGRLAASIVNGIQSVGVGACAKHFVGNESETKRRKYNVSTSGNSRTMRELYMKAFQYMLRESNPVSIMMAYNKIDGAYCSQTQLIRVVLRDAWKYNGCIMSDWYGTCAGAHSLQAGLDLEMPGPSVFRGSKLVEEFESGQISAQDIDRAALSVLTMIDRTRESHSDAPEQTLICERTSSMAYKVAGEGIVMLQNRRMTLPLDMATAPRIALIGAPAVVPVISGGGSAFARPQYTKTVLDCLRSKHTQPANVMYACGINSNHCAPAIPLTMLQTSEGTPGINVEYFNNDRETAILSESLSASQVIMLGRTKSGLTQENFRYIISATLTAATSGQHKLGAQLTGDYVLELDGNMILQGAAPDITVEDFLFVPKKLERTTEVYLEANKSYKLRLRVGARRSANNGEPTPHAAKLVLQEAFDNRQSIAEAVILASTSDTSIIFAGRTHEHESEGFDLPNIDLDSAQVRLIKAVSAVSNKTILILHHGNPIDLTPVTDDVDTILAAHFPGQEGASALTDIITGCINPSGRLATTWPMRLDATCVSTFTNFPCTEDAEPEIRYSEGLQLGYRHSSALTNSRFAFGHGLSYSTFTTSNLEVSASSEQKDLPWNEHILTARATVCNEGPHAGHHVVQLYVEVPQGINEPWRPVRGLVSFTKIFLTANETCTVVMHFLEKDVTSTWDEDDCKWRTRGGRYRFVIAESAVKQESCLNEMIISNDGQIWNDL